jgi:hypothetical protein
VTIAAQSQGHGLIVGTVKQIADRLEQWFTEGAADGFILTGVTLPHSLDDIVRLLLPELQRRDLFRRGYEGKTLRENLGLPFPISRYEAAAQPAAKSLSKVGAS